MEEPSLPLLVMAVMFVFFQFCIADVHIGS